MEFKQELLPKNMNGIKFKKINVKMVIRSLPSGHPNLFFCKKSVVWLASGSFSYFHFQFQFQLVFEWFQVISGGFRKLQVVSAGFS